MIVVLLYPPAQMIGETDDLAVGANGELEHTGAPGARFPWVRFEQLGELVYFPDKRGDLNLTVRGVGPWRLETGSWAGWREPTALERKAWTMHRAAVAGLVLPGDGGQPAGDRVS